MFQVMNEKVLDKRVDSNICILCNTNDANCSVCNSGALDFIPCDNKADK